VIHLAHGQNNSFVGRGPGLTSNARGVHEFVPANHLAHFVRDTVREALDLSTILDTYTEDRGFPPGMMVALLLYGYSRGVYSSRQLARSCEERVDVMAVTGLNRPDFHTIADFRKRHLAALADLFVQVLQLCRAAGLVQFGHVVVDGTKVKANASRHTAMSYARMKTTKQALSAEVDAWLDRAMRRMPPKIKSMEPTGAAMRCRSGWRTSNAASRQSEPQRRLWRQKRPIHPNRMTRVGRERHPACAGKVAPCEGRTVAHQTARSETSPSRTAETCRPETGSCRATTGRSPLMPLTRSLSLVGL
jgi:transposase